MKQEILKQMGIQSWRLRQQPKVDHANKESVADLVPLTADHLNANSEISQTNEVVNTAASDAIAEMVEKPNSPLADYDWAQLLKLMGEQGFCSSCQTSTPIIGEGDINADWMFVIDSPSSRDIEHQQLLMGRVGQLFDAILLALGLKRTDIYLSSIFKCPPSAEVAADKAQCDAVVHRQISLIQPKVVIAFGEFAAQTLIKTNDDLSKLRTNEQPCFNQPVPLIATYSLAQMLDEPLLKSEVWQDLKRGLLLAAN